MNEPKRRCPYCKSELGENDKFCRVCGSRIPQDTIRNIEDNSIHIDRSHDNVKRVVNNYTTNNYTTNNYTTTHNSNTNSNNTRYFSNNYNSYNQRSYSPSSYHTNGRSSGSIWTFLKKFSLFMIVIMIIIIVGGTIINPEWWFKPLI